MMKKQLSSYHLRTYFGHTTCYISANQQSIRRVCNSAIVYVSGFHSQCMNESKRPVDSSDIMKQNRLFTPGPLTTSLATKESMLLDMGSRDKRFIDILKSIRDDVVGIAIKNPNRRILYGASLMQGCGTMGVESCVSTVVPRGGKLLVLANGHYGDRIGTMCKRYDINHMILHNVDGIALPAISEIERILKEDSEISTVAAVHHETTTGIRNQVEVIGELIKKYPKVINGIESERFFIVDAMSSFGGIELDVDESNIDFMVSSSNKCIEGVPGFSFSVMRLAALEACKGSARTLSLDLYDQFHGFEKNGQFRFTPPTHSIVAFRTALDGLFAEGGVSARAARYSSNQRLLREMMAKLGFQSYLDEQKQSHIITGFLCPSDPNWDFERFYTLLSDESCIIYPGTIKKVDTFRIGSIGHLFEDDFRHLITSIEKGLGIMGVKVPVAPPAKK